MYVSKYFLKQFGLRENVLLNCFQTAVNMSASSAYLRGLYIIEAQLNSVPDDYYDIYKFLCLVISPTWPSFCGLRYIFGKKLYISIYFIVSI